MVGIEKTYGLFFECWEFPNCFSRKNSITHLYALRILFFVKFEKCLSHPDPNITFHCNKYTSLNMVIVYYLFKSFWILLLGNYILSLDFASVTLELASDELCLSIHFLIELIFNLFPGSKYWWVGKQCLYYSCFGEVHVS